MIQGIAHGQISPKLTCKFLQQQVNWIDRKSPEINQLDSYNSLNMFGVPYKPPQNCNILALTCVAPKG